MRTVSVTVLTAFCLVAAVPSPAPSPSVSPTLAPSLQRIPATVITSRTLIHPSDQLAIAVFGDQSLTQTVTVSSDGSIEYPLVGRVMVAGKTPSQAAALITNRLHEYVRHPVVNVSISQLGQIDVLVLGGDVKTPGKYQLRSDARVTDAIAAAGGLSNTNGAFPVARVADADGRVNQVSLESLLQRGDTALDEPLGQGSVVYVPGPVQFNVDVAGAVDHPGEVQVNEGDRLSIAIAKAGNSQAAQSDLNHIRLIRNVDGKQTTTEINLYQALKGGDQSADPVLHKNDVIYVPESYQHRSNVAATAGTGILYILSRLLIP